MLLMVGVINCLFSCTNWKMGQNVYLKEALFNCEYCYTIIPVFAINCINLLSEDFTKVFD